jgi:hypothetical protein
MIAEIPASALELPDHALWDIGGFVLTVLISGFSGYRWGLRSQKHAERLKTKIDVLAIIDGIFLDIPKHRELCHVRFATNAPLLDATIRLGCQLSDRKRLRVTKALEDYRALDISYYLPPTEGQWDFQKIDKEHKEMTEGLQRLRDEISDT